MSYLTRRSFWKRNSRKIPPRKRCMNCFNNRSSWASVLLGRCKSFMMSWWGRQRWEWVQYGKSHHDWWRANQVLLWWALMSGIVKLLHSIEVHFLCTIQGVFVNGYSKIMTNFLWGSNWFFHREIANRFFLFLEIKPCIAKMFQHIKRFPFLKYNFLFLEKERSVHVISVYAIHFWSHVQFSEVPKKIATFNCCYFLKSMQLK